MYSLSKLNKPLSKKRILAPIRNISVCNRYYTDRENIASGVPYETSLHKENDTKTSEKSALPRHADVVVIGGGVMGCSAYYHLSKMMNGNVVLLEKHKLTSGTTWHTAGLYGQLRTNDVDCELVAHGRALMTSILEEECGHHTGWVETGSIFPAVNEDRLNQARELCTLGKLFGIQSFILDADETKQVHPFMNTSDIVGSLYVPSDGTVDPAGTCIAYTRSAAKYNGKMFEGCEVKNISLKQSFSGRNEVKSVETNFGTIETNAIVNCTGVFAPFIGKMIGVTIPQLTFKHSYVIMEPIEGIKHTPCVRIPEGVVYAKRQGDVLQIGGFEPNPIPWEVEKDFAFGLFDLEWHTIDHLLAAACNRIPAIEKSGITSTVVGPESFTPDHKAILGEDPGVKGFFHCTAMNSLGMQFSGGFGKQIAHWVVDGKPELPMFQYDIRRFPINLKDYKLWLKEKTHESFASHYKIHYPYDQQLGGRDQRTDTLHQKLLAKGAFNQHRHGWERPSYFTEEKADLLRCMEYDYYGAYDLSEHEDYPYRDELKKEYSFKFNSNVKAQIGKECLTTRTSAAVFNMTSYGKLQLSGPDASKVAQMVFTKDVTTDKHIGRCSYVLMLKKDAGIEADVIVSTSKDQNGLHSYYITVGCGVPIYCRSIIQNVIHANNFNCGVLDKTDDIGILSVQGPNSLAIMTEIVDDWLTIQDLKFSRFYTDKINGFAVTIARLSFVGEQGYEIHCEMKDLPQIYEAVEKHMEKYDAIDAGFRAIHSMSTEVGFHHWPHTIRQEDNPFESGLERLCSINDQRKYIGKEELIKKQSQFLQKKLVTFTCDADVPFYGNEVIFRNHQIVGSIRSADFSYSLNTNILHGYLSACEGLPSLEDVLISDSKGQYFIERMNRKWMCDIHLNKPFDQEMKRLLGEYDKSTQIKLKKRLSAIAQ